jgi:hypothetical protein
MLNYICAIIIIFIVFFFYCHISRVKTLNNDLNILQIGDTDPEVLYDLLSKHQPIVYQREIYAWKYFNKLIGQPLDIIKNTIATSTEINYADVIKINLEPNNLPLSYDWNIDIRNVVLNETSSIFFIRQLNYMQLFGCVKGEIRIIISPPNQSAFFGSFINSVSSLDATQLLDKDPMEVNFIEIIIRTGNMIYIPYGWHYFIYKNTKTPNNDETILIDCLNKSMLNYM